MSKLADPILWVGGYDLHVYCDHYHEPWDRLGSGEFYGNNETQAKAVARKAGWVFHRDRTTSCKRHSKN